MRPDAFHREAGGVEHRAQAVRRVSKVVVRLFVQPEREGHAHDDQAVFADDPPDLVEDALRLRRVLEDLHRDDGIEAPVPERQRRSVVDGIGLRRAARRLGGAERRLALDPHVLVDVRPKDGLVRLVAAADIEQPAARPRRDCRELLDDVGKLEVDPVGRASSDAADRRNLEQLLDSTLSRTPMHLSADAASSRGKGTSVSGEDATVSWRAER